MLRYDSRKKRSARASGAPHRRVTFWAVRLSDTASPTAFPLLNASPPPAAACILVPDGSTRSALAVTRSLGRAGHRVIVAAPRAASLAGSSRYAAATAIVPDPGRSPEQFAASVQTLVRVHAVQVVLPTTEEAILALLPVRDRLGARLPLPETQRFLDANDKDALLDRARRLGIAVPAQVVMANQADSPPEQVQLPAVVKPSRSVPLGTAVRHKVTATHVETQAALLDVLRTTPPESFPLLVQQRIVGAGIGVFFLVWDGRVVARFAHRRLREKPPSGGVSVLSESIDAPAELDAAALRLLEPASWRGVAMVEFKVDEETGTPYLMEINARVWGSLQLAIDAGVDFPRLLVECALGHPPSAPVVGEAGHRLRWWFGDLDHLIIRLKRERGVRPRLAALATFLVGGRGARNEILRADDWRPALREAIDWIRRR